MRVQTEKKDEESQHPVAQYKYCTGEAENSGGLNSLLTAIRAICCEIIHIVPNQAGSRVYFN